MTQNKLKNAGIRELLALLFRQRRRKRVVGLSMHPTLVPDDVVLVDLAAYRKAHPQPGDVVVAHLPSNTDSSSLEIIKRVQDVAEDGSCFLVGDNRADSQDSRVYGRFMLAQIAGQVTSLFSPAPTRKSAQSAKDQFQAADPNLELSADKRTPRRRGCLLALAKNLAHFIVKFALGLIRALFD